MKRGWNYTQLSLELPRDSPLEALAVLVERKGGSPINVLNVYAPPVNSGTLEEALLDVLPVGNGGNWIVCGDFNAHHVEWDSLVVGDSRGRRLMDLADEHMLAVLNDGTPTRAERGTQRLSSPDVTLCTGSLAANMRWEVIRGMSSDHFPIVCELGGREEAAADKAQPTWDWKSANCDACGSSMRQ